MITKSIKCAALSAALGLATLAAADGTLKSVSVDKSGPGVAVHIKGNDLARPTTSWDKNETLVLEFDAKLASRLSPLRVNDDGVNTVTVQRRSKQDKVRLYIGLDNKSEPVLTKTDSGWLVKFAGPQVVAQSFEPKVARIKAEEPVTYAYKGPAKIDRTGDNARVSLEFVNTEVVQILKALAMQAGVNIVTAPEVKGTLTVSLDNVTVKEALDMVTTVSNLRYSKIGGAYLVTTPDKFKAAVDNLSGRKSMMLETKVVPIFSGQANEVRASVLSAMADDASFGHFQMFLPGENYKLEKKKETSASGESSSTDVTIEKGNAAAAKVEDSGDPNKGVSVTGMKEQYLVLVGPRDTIGEVESRIRSLDSDIAKAHGGDLSGNVNLIRKAYVLKSDDVKANDLVKAVSSTQPNSFLNVDLYATPPAFQTQSVVIVGREAEVAKAEAILQDLDSSGYGSDVWMYDVKHSDPRALRESLIAHVKGLRVAVAPAAAGNTRVYEEGKAVQQANQSTSAYGNGSMGGEQQSNDAKVREVNDEAYGLVSPFQSLERVAVPMRLTLTGTKEQLESARNYLGQVDIPAKQVALELRVMEMSKEDAERIGIDWDIFKSGSGVNLFQFNGSTFSSLSAGTTLGASINGDDWGGDVTAVLDSAANKNNMIARPNLLAIDGRESEIFVGDIIRYVESVQASTNGTTVTTGKVPVGVRLAVLPRVGDGNLTLDLRPAVSSLTGWLDVGDGAALPQTSLRTAQSTVSIRSGQTIAIGGLIQDQDVNNFSKVPILGDLPLIGRLFQKTEKTKQRREIVLFLTAKEVKDSDGDKPTAAHPRTHDGKAMPQP